METVEHGIIKMLFDEIWEGEDKDAMEKKSDEIWGFIQVVRQENPAKGMSLFEFYETLLLSKIGEENDQQNNSS